MKYIIKQQNKNHFFQFNETGRSMIEMLGVLAIIGVLSMAGIMGYKMAMAHYTANEIMADVQLRATETATNIFSHGVTIPLDGVYNTEFGETNPLGNPVETVNKNGSFIIYVDNVTRDVCHSFISRAWGGAPVLNIFINQILYTTTNLCTDDNLEIGFQFANDLGYEIVATEINDTAECSNYLFNTPGTEGTDGCPTGYRCGGGICIPTTETCSSYEFVKNHAECKTVPNKPHCWAYTCMADCSTATDKNAYCSALNPQQPICDETSGTCVECQTNTDCNNGQEQGSYYCTSPLRSIEGCTEKGDTNSPNKCLRTTGKTEDGIVLSDRYLNYYESENFCKALGKDLISATELRLNRSNLYTLFGNKMIWEKADSSIPNCRAYLLELATGTRYYAWRHANQFYEWDKNYRQALCK